ncbi:MAG: hypothetical protein OXN95_01075 [bacterium]|nr:hypothetical protein [bacterium]
MLAGDRFVDAFGLSGEHDFLEVGVVEVSRDDFVVVGHAVDHQHRCLLTNGEFELLERVGCGSLDVVLVAPTVFQYILKE